MGARVAVQRTLFVKTRVWRLEVREIFCVSLRLLSLQSRPAQRE